MLSKGKVVLYPGDIAETEMHIEFHCEACGAHVEYDLDPGEEVPLVAICCMCSWPNVTRSCIKDESAEATLSLEDVLSVLTQEDYNERECDSDTTGD